MAAGIKRRMFIWSYLPPLQRLKLLSWPEEPENPELMEQLALRR
jgi:hypothetical protein